MHFIQHQKYFEFFDPYLSKVDALRLQHFHIDTPLIDKDGLYKKDL
jgi:hypothetical protein